jgi:RNA methyltransferase, TrmH family
MKRRQDRSDPKRKAADQFRRVAGLPAVSALFANAAGNVERLFFDERTKSQVQKFCQELARSRKPYRLVPGDELARIAGTPMHGGVVALAQPQQIRAFDLAEAQTWARGDNLLLVLDGVGNPHNLGAIVRTAAFFGVRRIVLTGHPAQAAPSDASYRVAEGGFEYVTLYRAARFPAAANELRRAFRLIGTAPGQHGSVAALRRTDKPYALVLGNEEDGLPRATLNVCDEIVAIPGTGSIQSLNVAATAAILIFALASNRTAD